MLSTWVKYVKWCKKCGCLGARIWTYLDSFAQVLALCVFCEIATMARHDPRMQALLANSAMAPGPWIQQSRWFDDLVDVWKQWERESGLFRKVRCGASRHLTTRTNHDKRTTRFRCRWMILNLERSFMVGLCGFCLDNETRSGSLPVFPNSLSQKPTWAYVTSPWYPAISDSLGMLW